jgi:hypothetical protein
MRLIVLLLPILASLTPTCRRSAPPPPATATAPSASASSPTSASAAPLAWPAFPLLPHRATDPASGHPCTEIDGPANLALSFDGGKTLVQSRTPRREDVKVEAVVALGTPYTLAALIFDGSPELFVSVDGGCRWVSGGRISAHHMVEGRHGVAHAWLGDDSIFAIAPDSVRPLKAPADVDYVEVDSENDNHLRVLARGKQGVFESVDGGRVWRRIGAIGWVDNDWAVSTTDGDMDHLLIRATRGRPLWMTRDGGRTWVTPAGIPHGDEDLPLLSRGGQVAWSFGKQIFRSTDGGATFTKVAHVTTPDEGRTHFDFFLFGAQADADVLVFSVLEDRSPAHLRVPEEHSQFVLRFDTKSYRWTKQILPIDPGDRTGGNEIVTSGTLVPGEPTTLCLGISKRGPEPQRRPGSIE